MALFLRWVARKCMRNDSGNECVCAWAAWINTPWQSHALMLCLCFAVQLIDSNDLFSYHFYSNPYIFYRKRNFFNDCTSYQPQEVTAHVNSLFLRRKALIPGPKTPCETQRFVPKLSNQKMQPTMPCPTNACLAAVAIYTPGTCGVYELRQNCCWE